MLTNQTISAGDVTKSAGDITIPAIVSDSIFSYNGFHFVITDVFLTFREMTSHPMSPHPMTSQSPPFYRILFLVTMIITRDVIFL